MDRELLIVPVVLGLVIAFILSVFVFIASISYLVHDVPVICKVDGNIVYQGRDACINVGSSGANTTVSISGGPLCLFPKAYYVSSDVDLIGKK